MPNYSSNVLFDCDHSQHLIEALSMMMTLNIFHFEDIKEYLTIQDEIHICLAEFKRQLRVTNPRYRGGKMVSPPKGWTV